MSMRTLLNVTNYFAISDSCFSVKIYVRLIRVVLGMSVVNGGNNVDRRCH